MNYLELLHEIFEVAIIPLIGVLATFLVQYIKIKQQEILVNCENDLAKKYVELLSQTIVDCVVATNQTYVDSLKAEGKFDAEAQKVAFQKTYDAVLAILTDDAKECLEKLVGDLSTYISQQIEAQVKLNK